LIRIVFQFELSALTGSAIWSGHHAARIQSTFAIPAARYLCDLSLRTDDLDLVGRPDKHVIGRAILLGLINDAVIAFAARVAA
jgi:hypothetical protein